MVGSAMKTLTIFLFLAIVLANNIRTHKNDVSNTLPIDGEQEIMEISDAAGTAIDLYVAGDSKALEDYSIECYHQKNDWTCIYFDIAAYRILSNENAPTEYFLESSIDSRNYSKINESVRLRASKELIESIIDHLMNNSPTVDSDKSFDGSLTVETPTITVIEE